ncbi:phage tail tape measure protein, partial [Halomonas elongata]|uniref:phage tail tape measure protein n=1 Tax=Halomonas elongata TaxID=2746 RepID=UPI00255B1BC2
LGRTADIASNIAGTFKIDLEQDGAMTRVADILSATASRANVDLEKLGNTVKYLGGVEGLDITLEQATAMAGMLGNVGIQGSQAGTTLRAMMNRLTEPTAEAAGVIDSLGIKVADAQGNMRAMPEILRDINDATKEMGNVERKAALQKVFGAEAGSGMAELVTQMSTGALDELIAKLEVAAGENARMARTMEDNIGGDLKSLNSAWQEVGITLTDTNEGPLRDLIQNVTAITRAVGDWMKANPELTGQLATAAASIAALVAVGGALTLSLASILGPVAAVRYGMELFGIKTEGAGKKAKKVSKGGIKALGGALKWLGRLIAWVGRAFLLNPIGLVVTAIAGAAYLIYRNWDRVGPWFADLWQGIKAKASALWQWLKNIAPAVGDAIKRYFMNWTLPGLLIQHWDSIKATASKLWEWFKNAPRNAINAVARLIRDWDLKGILKEKWTAAIDYIKSLPSRMKAAGADLARGLRDGIKDKAGDAWRAMTETAAGTEETARQRLQTRSPSRVFMAIGRDTMTGLQRGIVSSEQAPLGQVSQFSKRLRQAGAGLSMGALSLPSVAAPDIPTPNVSIPAVKELAGMQLVLPELPDIGSDLAWPELPSLPELKVTLPNIPRVPVETPRDIAIDNRPPLQAQGGGGITIQGGINIEVNASPGMDEQALARYVRSEVQRALDEAQRDVAAQRRSSFYDID